MGTTNTLKPKFVARWQLLHPSVRAVNAVPKSVGFFAAMAERAGMPLPSDGEEDRGEEDRRVALLPEGAGCVPNPLAGVGRLLRLLRARESTCPAYFLPALC